MNLEHYSELRNKDFAIDSDPRTQMSVLKQIFWNSWVSFHLYNIQMFLENLNKKDGPEAIMNNHRRLYYMFKTLVTQRKFDAIEPREVNQ